MIVCIAEKPSVGRDIARILGATSAKDGYIEGNGYQVTWALGHLCTLKEPHDYAPQWKSWSLGNLPMIPPRFGIKVIDNPGAIKQFRIVEQLIQKADMIINCGDAGQEGELIQRWIMQKAGAKCPVKRLWISSLTDEAIAEGFKKLLDQSEKQSLYEAGLCRAIGDWLLGMNATRLYTIKYGQSRQVLEPGWRTVFTTIPGDEKDEDEELSRKTLQQFVKGESGPHIPELVEKWTSPPKPFTEATLLRAMETAGKLVNNDELRDAMKENGIGRPSTRAAIINTLFKRNYIRRERKTLVATATGVELIQLIHEELLKSAELTGIWEKKLREIERCAYSASQFLEELKQMVAEVVLTVMSDNSNRRISLQEAVQEKATARKKTSATEGEKKLSKKRTPKKKVVENPDNIVGTVCPLCGKGTIIKGNSAYGCSEWKAGCSFRKPFA